jgi:hypothetical protein
MAEAIRPIIDAERHTDLSAPVEFPWAFVELHTKIDVFTPVSGYLHQL